MAYLAATLLDAYRLPYADSKLDQHEHRLSNYGALETFKNDTPNLVRADLIEMAKKAQAHTTSIPVIKTKDYTISTTRACSVISNSNVSALVSLSFSTVRWGFHMVPSQYGNNSIAYQEDFNRKLNDSCKKVLTTLDTACYTKLNADKSVVNNAASNPWPIASDTMEVPVADANLFLNELDSVMSQNDHAGPYNIVASPRFRALVNYLNAQGVANATNTAFQIMGFNVAYSNRVTVASGDRDTVFVMPAGSLGFIPWVDPDSRMNQSTLSGKVWSIENLPLLGFEVGMLYQDSCADNSTEAGNGFEASKQEGFTFSFDYALLTSYNSDSATYPGSIFKAAISAT